MGCAYESVKEASNKNAHLHAHRRFLTTWSVVTVSGSGSRAWSSGLFFFSHLVHSYLLSKTFSYSTVLSNPIYSLLLHSTVNIMPALAP